MTKILLSFSSHLYHDGSFKLGCFYEGFIRSLKNAGNQVLVVNVAEFLHQSWNNLSNALPLYFNKTKIIGDVKKFNPDLVIAFNHCIPLEIEEICNCPIALWDADSIEFFSDKTYIKKHIDKYIFLAFSSDGRNSAIRFGARKEQIHIVPAATEVRSQKIPLTQDISFIGSNFYLKEDFMRLIRVEDLAKLKKRTNELKGKFYDVVYATKKNTTDTLLRDIFSIHDRITVLNNLQDLGLVIWGTQDWIDIGRHLPLLAMSFNKNIVYSIKHNQDIYNSSKLCISIAHAQATDGFPWRIMDIMASNGCLVSDYHSGITDFTKGYVEIPMYDNPYDARELCKNLLKDDKWREDIVLGSQKCIEDKGRWEHRFKEMEEIFGMKLLHKNQDQSTKNTGNEVIFLQRDSYIMEQEQGTNNTDNKVTFLQRDDYICRHSAITKHVITGIASIVPDRILRIGYLLLNKIFGLSLDQFFINSIKKNIIKRNVISTFLEKLKSVFYGA